MFAAGLVINGVVGSYFSDSDNISEFKKTVRRQLKKSIRRYIYYGLIEKEEVRELILKKWEARKRSRKLVNELPEKGTNKKVVKI